MEFWRLGTDELVLEFPTGILDRRFDARIGDDLQGAGAASNFREH